jgi:adenosylhomocysteine nucleosidase
MAVEGPAAVWDPESVLERPVAVDSDIADRLRSRGIRFVEGPCLSVPHLIPTTSMKRWIGETFATSIIDMESYWVAEAVAARGIPVGVARCVLDDVDQTLPEFVGGVVNDGKGYGFDKAIKYLARRPVETPKLIRLARQAKTAGESLSGLLSNLIDCLTAQPAATG